MLTVGDFRFLLLRTESNFSAILILDLLTRFELKITSIEHASSQENDNFDLQRHFTRENHSHPENCWQFFCCGSIQGWAWDNFSQSKYSWWNNILTISHIRFGHRSSSLRQDQGSGYDPAIFTSVGTEIESNPLQVEHYLHSWKPLRIRHRRNEINC